MPSTSTPTIGQHFAARAPVVRAIYDRLRAAAASFGPFGEEPKKTSIHLVRRTAFAGVATRKNAVILTLKASGDIRSKRITKHEQASANRWHLEIRLEQADHVDSELLAWFRQAYDLAG
jgi:hypothetical protein